MSRTVAVSILVIALLLVVLLVTVNVTRCDTFSGPLGFLRFSACSEEPLINP